MRRDYGPVVVTGASTGIGRDACRTLAGEGFRVIGTVRREEDMAALASEGTTALRLDVTDAASVESAASRVVELVGADGLAGLVNNAGIGCGGPLEFLRIDDFRRVVDVNVFGLLAVTQAFLPLLRRRRGRIVNISSVSGLMSFPLAGPYAASKFAVEALSDALRVELAPFGLHVALIEPGPVKTPLWTRTRESANRMRKELPPAAEEYYGGLMDAFHGLVDEAEAKAAPPGVVSDAILHALTARKPRTRYLVAASRLGMMLMRVLPDRWLDALIRRSLRPRRPPGDSPR